MPQTKEKYLFPDKTILLNLTKFFFCSEDKSSEICSGQTALDMDDQPLLQGTSNDDLTSRAEECPMTPTAELVPNQLHMSGIGGGECNPVLWCPVDVALPRCLVWASSPPALRILSPVVRILKVIPGAKRQLLA